MAVEGRPDDEWRMEMGGRGSSKCALVSSRMHDGKHDYVLTKNLIVNSIGKAAREHPSNALKLLCVQKCVVGQRRNQQLKLVEELCTKPTPLCLIPAGGDHQIEFRLGPNPDAPGHSLRLSSAKTSSAV